MRHRVYGKHLGRDKNERLNLFRGLVRSLVLHGKIETTDSKAKAIKGLVDKLVTASKKNTSATQGILQSFLTDKDLVKKFNDEVTPTLLSRTSGFTKVVRLGRRSGDGAMIVQVSWAGEEKEVKASKTEKIAEEKDEVKEEEVKEEKPKAKRKA